MDDVNSKNELDGKVDYSDNSEISSLDTSLSEDFSKSKVKNGSNVSNKKSTLLYLVIGILLVTLISLVVYWFITKDSKSTDDSLSSNDEITQNENDGSKAEDGTTDDSNVDSGVCSIDGECNDEEEESLTVFEGDYLSAELPDGWSVVEFENGDGTDYLVEGVTYTGLTALYIVNPDDERVFSMMAVNGIGFEGCPVYYRFKDNNESYELEMESFNDVVDGTWEVVDYTDADFSEFDFLGTTIRRIEKEYYYDTQEGNNYFEAPCHTGIITLEGFTFTDSDGYIGEAYFYGAENTAIEEDLLIVDGILGSMEVI